jgi:archaellum biogenesis ATPase FlaH
MESIGYGVTEAIRDGRLLVFSRFGTIAESIPDVGLQELLQSEAIELADVVIIDSASSIMPYDLDDKNRFELMRQLRQICSSGRSLMLCVDPEEMDHKLMYTMCSSAEVVLDLQTAMIGGEIKRNIVITRFLRAAGPIQTSIGWRVEPGMGFIVDITAVS